MSIIAGFTSGGTSISDRAKLMVDTSLNSSKNKMFKLDKSEHNVKTILPRNLLKLLLLKVQTPKDAGVKLSDYLKRFQEINIDFYGNDRTTILSTFKNWHRHGRYEIRARIQDLATYILKIINEATFTGFNLYNNDTELENENENENKMEIENVNEMVIDENANENENQHNNNHMNDIKALVDGIEIGYWELPTLQQLSILFRHNIRAKPKYVFSFLQSSMEEDLSERSMNWVKKWIQHATLIILTSLHDQQFNKRSKPEISAQTKKILTVSIN
jgi:hypothetical protein